MKKNNIADRILTYQDVYDLCEKLDITVMSLRRTMATGLPVKTWKRPLRKEGWILW
jgi:hypothetical protein